MGFWLPAPKLLDHLTPLKSDIIDKINKIARYNLIDTKYCQMAFRSATAPVVARFLGTPGQTKVSGDRQTEATHEICSRINAHSLGESSYILRKPHNFAKSSQ